MHRQGQSQRALRVNGMDHARSQRQPRAPGASGAQAMSNTHVATIGIDLGKNIFHVVGLDATGAIALRKKTIPKSTRTIAGKYIAMPDRNGGLRRRTPP